MKKDKWTSPDNYHIQDLLALGRCALCGSLAHLSSLKKYKGYEFYSCSIGCEIVLKNRIDDLENEDILED